MRAPAVRWRPRIRSEFVDRYPDSCHGCGHEFGEDEKLPSRRPGRRQVAELPPITVIVTEHRSHRLRCPCCKRRTAAGFPAAVADSAFGPRLQAAIVTLTARNRISRRDLSELARELFGIRLSIGTVDAICRRSALALAEPHQALVGSVLRSAAVNVATGWVTAGNNRTLWTATTPEAAIFRIAADRHRDRLQELLGERFAGICCSDRWWAYNQIDPESRQACWSHLQRDFRFHAEGLPTQKHAICGVSCSRPVSRILESSAAPEAVFGSTMRSCQHQLRCRAGPDLSLVMHR